MIVSGGVAWIRRAVEACRDDEDAARERLVRVALARAEQPAPVPARPLEALARLAHAAEQLRHLGEHDEACRARERVAGMRVRVDVLRPELPGLLEAVAVEQRRRKRQAAAERLADAEHVRDFLARPHLADAA